MNPYTHHSSLTGSPHHAQSGPHHGYSTGGSGGGGNGSTTTPDPSPHSPPYGAQPDSNAPYSSLQSGQGLGSNGHHHGPGNMMVDQPHHQAHSHPHLSGHLPYPPVNHNNNNNCTLKQEGVPVGQTGIQQCAGCGGTIVEKWIFHALDRYWHHNCLKCTSCGSILAEVGPTCYVKNQMILCRNDYSRLFGPSGSCGGCGQTIPATDYIRKAGGAVFHLKCFQCSKCCTPLHNGDRYYFISGAPMCEPDWQKLVKSSAMAVTAAAAGNGGAPVRKGKVGRPRRSRE